MNMVKRVSYYFFAFALCAAMSLGSLSFLPKSFAWSSSDTSFELTLSGFDPSEPLFVVLTSQSVGSGFRGVNVFTGVTSASFSSSLALTGNMLRYIYPVDDISLYNSPLSLDISDFSSPRTGTSFSFFNSQVVMFGSSEFLSGHSKNRVVTRVSYPPISSIPRYLDYMPFYFPELPHGYFDGNINVLDGSYNIDFPSNASISGAITQTGIDHYTWTWNHGTLYWNGETVQGEHEGWISPDYQQQTPPNGDITQTAYANRLINLSLSDLDSVVNYTPAYNENSRFRCWSCVMDSSYVWFISDTRNKITGSIVSVTSDEVSWKYEFADPHGGNSIYPIWAIVFSPMGEVIQVLSPTTVSNKNTYTLSCSIGTLEQDQDTGIWSCDPLYHGFWFSNDSPPVANITRLNVAENKKYLANPVFGESAFQLQFLESINLGIADINSNIQSLQSAMQSSISGQTSDFQNMDAPSAPQPSTSQMMDYFSKESAFSAPNTDEVFSGDIKSGHYWDGVTWWSSKFNDIIVSNQVIVAFTTAMLTLGLAVLIIGRRFNMR